MINTDKLKSVKATIVTALLSVAAAIAPLKGQSVTAEPTTKDVVTTTEFDKAAWRHQKFEKAVRQGASKEEIAKYIDFPEFIPVTKDGQFDRDKAEKWGKILAPYMKTLIKNGRTMSAADVYRAFKEKTGQENISPEDFERVKELAQTAAAKNFGKKLLLFPTVPLLLFTSLMTGIALVGIAQEAIIAKGNLKKMHKTMQGDGHGLVCWNIKSGLLGALATTALLSGVSVFLADKTKSYWNSTPECQVPVVYEAMYDTYVDKSIDEQEKKFEYQYHQQKQLEWQRVQDSLRQK